MPLHLLSLDLLKLFIISPNFQGGKMPVSHPPRTLLITTFATVVSPALPRDRNSILCWHCVSFTFAWVYCRLLFNSFCILCSVPTRCWSFTAKL